MEELRKLSAIQFTHYFWILLLPISLMAFDVVTGVLNAWIKHDIKSYRLREGLVKKFGETSIIAIGVLFNCAFALPLYTTAGLSIYIIIMELISICENLNKMGVPIPKFIERALHQTADKIQNDSERKEDTSKDGTKSDDGNRKS